MVAKMGAALTNINLKDNNWIQMKRTERLFVRADAIISTIYHISLLPIKWSTIHHHLSSCLLSHHCYEVSLVSTTKGKLDWIISRRWKHLICWLANTDSWHAVCCCNSLYKTAHYEVKTFKMWSFHRKIDLIIILTVTTTSSHNVNTGDKCSYLVFLSFLMCSSGIRTDVCAISNYTACQFLRISARNSGENQIRDKNEDLCSEKEPEDKRNLIFIK